MPRTSAAALPLVLALAVAACGGSTATPAPSSAASSAPSNSAAPTATADASAAPSVVAPSLPNQGNSLAPDLEAKLPDSVGGVAFQKASFDGSVLGIYGAAAGLDDSELGPILQANNKTINDVRFAIASPAAAGSTSATAFVYAIQIEGVPASEFMTAVGGADAGDQLTVSGKTVYGSVESGIGSVVYPKDDVVYLVLALTPGLIDEIVQQLP